MTRGDDADLLRRAQRGDRLAFGVLYDRHASAVFWQAHGVLGDADLAQDVAQETFVTAWRRLNDITVVDGSLAPWLLVTARYTALNHRRRRRRPDHDALSLDDSSHETAAASASVHDQAEQREVRRQIERVLEELTPLERRIYDLCVEEGRTYEQAAQELGLSHGALRNRLSRLRQRLRRDLRAVWEAS